jgi:uncharacterized membrane protein
MKDKNSRMFAGRSLVSTLYAAGRDRAYFTDLTARVIAVAFVFYGLIAVGILAINVPPFQIPDEAEHFKRAAQIAHGELIAFRFSTLNAAGEQQLTAGGHVDPALLAAYEPFQKIIFHTDARVMRGDWAPGIRWSGTQALQRFPNTAQYPPFFYLPSALGVRLGELAGLTVLQTLTLSRLLTGISAVVVGAVAIALAGGAAPWLFVILTLPMSLSQIASASQDALLLTCSALAGALFIRASRSPDRVGTKELVKLTIVLSLVAVARPPYAALALLLVVLTKVPAQSRFLAIAAITTCVAVWSGIVVAKVLTNHGAFMGTDPAAQIEVLKNNPPIIIPIAFHTVIAHGREYIVQFVGQLGWLDVTLPPIYHVVARIMLVVGLAATILGLGDVSVTLTRRLLIVAAILLSVAGVFLLVYVTFNVPGNPTVDNVQGRHFLPVALAGVIVLSGLANSRWHPLLYVTLVTMLIAFPMVTICVVTRAVVLRYYLG